MASPSTTASWLDRIADRLGYQRKARQRIRWPAMRAVAEHGLWDMPDLAQAGNQLKTYQQFSAVYRAVRMIAEPMALVPLNVFEWKGEDKEGVPNHEFEKLLRRPNPVHSFGTIMQRTAAFLELAGNAYWYIAYERGGSPGEIWVMRPDRVRPIPHPKEFVSGYIHTVDDQETRYDVNEVVHFQRYHPRKDFTGMSAIETLAYQLVGDQGMTRWNANFFNKDRAMPAGILNAKGQMTDNDFERLKKEFAAMYGGTERRTLVTTDNELEWTDMGLSHQDMQFLEGRNFTLDEIMGVFGIPAGKYRENATEANAKVADATFKAETLWPKLTSIANQISHSLIQPAYGPQFIVEFEDIRPEDKRLWLDEVTTIMAGTMGNGGLREPVLTRDEVRERYFQLDPFPEEEKPEVPPALQLAAGQKPKRDEDEDEDGREEPQPEKSADDDRAKWERKALSALKRGKSADVAFETTVIPPHERVAIHEALAGAETPEEVKAAFSGPFCPDWEGYP